MDRQESRCIRQFRVSDLGTVRDLIHHTIDVAYVPVYPPRAVKFFKEFHSEEKIMERHRQGNMVIVEQDSNVIATGSIVGSDIFGVFVHPEFQCRGCGKALMQELERKALEKGMSEITLSISLPSRKFYESLGYRITKDCTLDVGEGQQLDYWEGKKALVRRER